MSTYLGTVLNWTLQYCPCLRIISKDAWMNGQMHKSMNERTTNEHSWKYFVLISFRIYSPKGMNEWMNECTNKCLFYFHYFGAQLWISVKYTYCYGLNFNPPKFIHWTRNTQYLRMWPYVVIRSSKRRVS